MRFDLDTFRLALTITLAILLLLVLFRRFKRRTLAADMPAPQHAEIRSLEVAYHPARLLVVLHMPATQQVHTGLLNAANEPLVEWPAETLPAGVHRLERSLVGQGEGDYHLEVRTVTQRTLRRFRLQHT